ncbi:hypothetical protein BWX40_10195 [Prevotella intermedia]|nr:hypothetical protein BWX40_10195 [Prevotella intermedia]
MSNSRSYFFCASASPRHRYIPNAPFRLPTTSEISLQKINAFSLVFQKRLFCSAKQPLLPCKTYAFAMRNNRFWNAKA